MKIIYSDAIKKDGNDCIIIYDQSILYSEDTGYYTAICIKQVKCWTPMTESYNILCSSEEKAKEWLKTKCL